MFTITLSASIVLTKMNTIFKSILLICLVCSHLLQHVAGDNLRSVAEFRYLAGHLEGDSTNYTMASSDDVASEDREEDHDDHGSGHGGLIPVSGIDDD